MGPPAPHAGFMNGCSTEAARFSGAVVDPQRMLKSADNPFRTPVIADRGAFGLNGLPEDLPDKAMQASSLVPVQGPGRGQGMDSGPEKAFIDINITQAADKALIQQQGLNGPFFLLQALIKIPGGQVKGIRGQIGQGGPFLPGGQEAQESELPHIPITQLQVPGLQMENEMGMFVRRPAFRDQQQLPGHFEVNEQRGSISQTDQDELAFSFNFFYDGARKLFSEAWQRRPQQRSGPDPDRSNLPSDQLFPEAADYGFYFRQFGHDF